MTISKEQIETELEEVGHDNLSVHFLDEAHRLSSEIQEIGEAFNNPGLYPFELTQTAILLSIAHGVQALNQKIETVLAPAWKSTAEAGDSPTIQPIK